MNSTPIAPATVEYDAQGLRHVPAYVERADADEAEGGFLEGNELPLRWRARPRFVVMAIGFGTGHAFLATLRAWRSDPARCDRLVYIATEPYPLARADLRTLHPPGDETADTLCAAWPPLTHNLHRLSFEGARVQLLLAFGPVRNWLPELIAEVDAFYLDGPPTDSDPRRFKALGRLAARGATLAAHRGGADTVASLHSAGFVVLPSTAGMTRARFDPAFTPRRAPARVSSRADVDFHAIVVGAGLAGCAMACALAAQGWRSTVIERHETIASEASGNRAGLFHGIVNAQDGIHARFNRAAALSVAQEVAAALRDGTAASLDGLLRLEHALKESEMRALLERLGLPADYVMAASAAEASARAGRPIAGPAWYYAGGGWVDPAGLAAHYLRRAGLHAELRTGLEVHALEASAKGWRLLDRHGNHIAESRTVILANAADALRLLGEPDWPIESVRGQVSLARQAPFALPRLPIAGSGYLLPRIGEWTMFGATAQSRDQDPAVRLSDHATNLLQLERLLGGSPGLDVDTLEGRTGWRCTAKDRLPVIGGVPDLAAKASRSDQPRYIPRLPGLYVLTGLGSRGIAWSALGAHVLAALVAGSAVPVEASLVDAIDPARFASKQSR